MIEVLTKPFEQIAPSDIQALIDSKVPEGEQIEYKKELSRKGDGSPNPWMSNEEEIGDKAKNAILKEAVAFANAYGGALLLGIRESKTKPSVAAEIIPIPRCAELAERLKLVFRNRVEPELPRIEIFAVPTECDSGVVIIRVGGQSRLAPHRVTNLRVCPIRRQNRCEEMTMREIQDMTLNVSRGLERLDGQFAERANRFEDEFRHLLRPAKAFGVRVTGVPIGDEIRLNRVYSPHKIIEPLEEQRRRIFLAREGGEPSELEVFPDISTIFWRPLLRAARADSSSFFVNKGHSGNLSAPDYNSYREVHCSGLVELAFVASRTFAGEYENYLPPNLPIALIANLIVQAVRVREQAGIPTAEYAIEVQILAKGTPITVGRSGSKFGRPLGVFEPGSVTFPRYPLGDSVEALDLLNLFRRDLYNALGEDIDSEEDTFTIENWPTPVTDEGA